MPVFVSNLRAKVRRFVPLFVAAFVLAGTASAAGHVSDQVRRDTNETRLAKIHAPARPKFRAVISDLEANGYKPLIDGAVWRSPSEQAALVRKGHSKVYFSYHTATTPKGKPDSLAADIIDVRYGWSGTAPRGYWLRLANSGRVHGLNSGSYFGLSTTNKAKLKAALVSRDFAYSGSIGWDPAHLEDNRLSLGQTKAGKRPSYS